MMANEPKPTRLTDRQFRDIADQVASTLRPSLEAAASRSHSVCGRPGRETSEYRITVWMILFGGLLAAGGIVIALALKDSVQIGLGLTMTGVGVATSAANHYAGTRHGMKVGESKVTTVEVRPATGAEPGVSP